MILWRRYYVTVAASTVGTASLTSPLKGFITRISLCLAVQNTALGTSGYSYAWVSPATTDITAWLTAGITTIPVWAELIEWANAATATPQDYSSGQSVTVNTLIPVEVGSQSFLQTYSAAQAPAASVVLEFRDRQSLALLR